MRTYVTEQPKVPSVQLESHESRNGLICHSSNVVQHMQKNCGFTVPDHKYYPYSGRHQHKTISPGLCLWLVLSPSVLEPTNYTSLHYTRWPRQGRPLRSGRPAYAERNAKRKSMELRRKDWTKSRNSVDARQSQVSGLETRSYRMHTKQSIVRTETPMSTPGTNTPTSVPPRQPSSGAARPGMEGVSPEQARMQEEYLKALLQPASAPTGQNQSQAEPGADDPMLQMLQSLMGNMGGMGGPDGMGGMGADGNTNGAEGLPFSPDQLAQQFGMPSWATGMLFGGQKAPPTPAEEKSRRLWRIVHVVVAVASGTYLLFAMSRSSHTFGKNPPAPATFQNPFTVFMMAQLMLQGTRILLAPPAARSGIGLWFQMLKELARDGAIIVFMLGCASWWGGYTEYSR